MPKIRIASAEQLQADGQSVKFYWESGGRQREGFAARVAGKIVAYENVCRHQPLPLDYGDGRFFTTDGAHFICQNHGALFDPVTGVCVRGPCDGESLKALSLLESHGAFWFVS